MKQLICDNCRKEIYHGQVYYKVMRKSNDNAFFADTEIDLCSDCAKKMTAEEAGDEE
jgi:hypothetical protein